MLSFTEFKNEVVENIKSVMSDDFAEYEVSTQTINKSTGSYEGISVVPENRTGAYPTVSLNAFYDEYINGNKGVDECIEGIANIIEGNTNPDFGFNPMDIVHWDIAKARIVPTLMNIPNNEEYLADKVRKDISDDMTIVYNIVISEDENGLATAKVSNDFLSMWNITADELFDTAITNLTASDYSFGTIFDVMFSDTRKVNNIDDTSDGEPMYILSNKRGQFGASVILRNDIMEKLSEKFGAYYILPSSVHEVIIVPTDEVDSNKLTDMVNEVNGNSDIMSVSDILSNRVYRYDRETKKIVSI